jgi:hypothetical protein
MFLCKKKCGQIKPRLSLHDHLLALPQLFKFISSRGQLTNMTVMTSCYPT